MWSSLIMLAALAAGNDGFSQQMLQSLYASVSPAMAKLEYSTEVTDPTSGESSKRDGNALALIVSPEGLVMTHGHLFIENNEPFNMRLTVGRGDDEKKYEVVLLKKPDDLNVIFLRVKSDTPLRLPHVRFAPASNLKLGSPVTLFGMLGDTMDYSHGLQVARISSVIDKPRSTYCLDQSIRFGFVGGPVADDQGRLVGVSGFDLSRSEGGDIYVHSGHPLVFQCELFQKYIDQPPPEHDKKAEQEQGWLGVFTQPLSDDFAEYWNLPQNGGLIVSTIVPDSPATAANLQTGDIIVQFDGIPITAKLDTDVTGFTKLVRERSAGKTVVIKLLRNRQPMDVQVTIGARPRTSQDADEYEDPVFGITVRELTTDIRIAFNLPSNVQGVIVRRVKSGSAAQVAKMRPSVIIMSLGDYPVTSLNDYKAAVEKLSQAKPAEIPVFARVGSVTGFFRLQPRWKE